MILYLHGLNSIPNSDRINFLEKYYDTNVSAPQLDYYSSIGSTKLFSELLELIRIEKIRLIIGSSFGGYFGFHLSEYTNKPAILMNPALAQGSIVVPVLNKFNDTTKIIMLGKNDDIINPLGTKKYLIEKFYKNTIIIEGDYGHITPRKPFENTVNKYLSECLDIRRKQS